MSQQHEREPLDREEVVNLDETGGSVERHEVVRRTHGPSEEVDRPIVPLPDEPLSEHRERTVQDVAMERHLALHKASQLIWLIVVIVDGMIALRVFLKLIAANPGNPFAAFVDNFTAVFLSPFFGLTGTPAAGGIVLEVSSLVAILVYLLAAWVVDRLLWVILAPTSARSASSYRRFRR